MASVRVVVPPLATDRVPPPSGGEYETPAVTAPESVPGAQGSLLHAAVVLLASLNVVPEKSSRTTPELVVRVYVSIV